MPGNNTQPPQPMNMCCGRQTAAGLLVARADRLKQEAERLMILAKEIGKLESPAEDVLLEVFCDAFRHR